jgi:hypothetical protein
MVQCRCGLKLGQKLKPISLHKYRTEGNVNLVTMKNKQRVPARRNSDLDQPERKDGSVGWEERRKVHMIRQTGSQMKEGKHQ